MRARWLPVRVDDDDGWLSCLFAEGAKRLGAAPCGEPTPSASGDNIGGPVLHNGEQVWLRVAPYNESAMDMSAWTGTRDAGRLTGIRKPLLIDSTEWVHMNPVPIPVWAGLMTLVTDDVAAPGDQYLAEPLTLSSEWLHDLRASLEALAAHPTGRAFWAHSAERYGYLLHAVYGRALPADIEPAWGRTEHLDLHWGNVTVPSLTIIDWEHWGAGVAGYGAARLYCTALAVPTVADQLYGAFADVLDSPSGRYAQLVAAADILINVAYYEDSVDLCPALHDLARKIMG